jgi:hypothetical protein
MHVMQSEQILGECIILANFRNLKFWVLQTYPLKRNLTLEILMLSETSQGNLLCALFRAPM